MSDVRKLAKIVADHSRQIKGLSGGPQAAYSSIEGGSMDSYDSDGKLRLRIGAQDDGTQGVKYVQGPPPPRPTAPVVSVDGPVVRVRWDGMLMGGHIPEDFARIDVHFALASEDLEADEAVRGNLATSAGNETVLAATSTGTYRVGLVAMSQSRARSEMSETVDVDVTLVNLEGALDAVVENARGGSNYYTPEPPSGTDHDGDRDLWFDTSEDEDGLTRYTPHRWNGQEWVSLGDERVQAIKDAQADFESDLNTVRDTADGKNRTFYQSTMPATPPARAGDLWFNTANGYRLHRNNGATFIEVADGRIADIEGQVENIDISGPLSEARTEWLADAAADAQTKAQNAAAAAEAAAKLYADQIASGVEDVDLEGFKDYADNAAEQARQAAIEAAIAEARVIANAARDEALASALDADAIISQTVAQFESDLNLVRESADGKSKITWSPNVPSGPGEAGDTWFRTSSSRIIGYWRHSGSAWVGMSLDATVIPNLDAGKITSGYLDAARIKAGAITASHLAIGDFENLALIDPTHNVNVTYPGGWATVTTDDGYITAAPSASRLYLMFRDRSNNPPIRGGDRLLFEFRAKAAVPDVRGLAHLWTYAGPAGAPGASKGSAVGEVVAFAEEDTAYSLPLTIPAGVGDSARSWIIGLLMTGASQSHDLSVRDVRVRRMTGSTLIEDGAITTDKISAGAVGATAIAAESIDASKIVAGGIQADSLIVPGTVGSTLIKDGAVTTSKIEAGAITAQSGIIASLDAGVISSGAIDTARLAAGSITADKLLIGGAGNLLPGADDFATSRAGWSAFGHNANHPSVWLKGTQEVRTDAPFALRSGATYKASVDVQASVPGTTFYWQVANVDNGAINQYVFVQEAPGTSWTSHVAEFTVPATGNYRLRVYSNHSTGAPNPDGWQWFRAPRIVSMTGATLIEDGAITTEKIAAGAITAESGIIGSLDAGVITVGQMNGARIEAGSIDAEQLAFGAATGDVLSVDALNFKTAVGLDIRGSSFRAGDAVEMTEDFGIRQFGPDGALNVSLPSDGSPAEFRGDLSARTLTATGRMSIQGPGAVASGGVLELESGVVPPVAGPQITNTWDRTTMPPLEDNETPVGIAWADGHWWRAVDVSGVSEGDRIEKITPTGELVSSFPIVFYPRNGMTVIGDELFLLGIGDTPGVDKYTSKRYVRVYGLDGTFKRQWEDTAYQDNDYQPGIGTDGTSVIRAQASRATGILYLNYYNRTTGAAVSTTNTGDVFSADVAGVYIGSADFGSPKIVVAKKAQGGGRRQLTVFDNASPYTYRPELSWYAADYASPIGMASDGSRFYTLHQDGNLATYQPLEAGRFVGDDEDNWWGAVTWASGSQETTAGPATRFHYLHRAQLRVQNGDVPAGVEAARFYTSNGVSEPDRTDLRWRATSEQPHEPLRITSFSSFNAGTNPPATNTFTADAPGEIHSALGTFRVDGTGAGEWGPLAFHADGTMTGLPKIMSGVAALSANATANGGKSSVVVTFPPGRFDTPPAVTAIAENGRLVPSVEEGTLTKTSVQLNVFNWTTTASGAGVRMHWTAVEVSS